MVKFFPILISTLFASFLSYFTLRSRSINLFLMRFFRDVSRYKSRRRLYGNQAALIPILLGNEQPLDLQINNPIPGGNSNDNGGDNNEEYHNDFTMTLSQLQDMNGATEQTPIYIALNGLIYDVSAARELYGPQGKYQGFAGKDNTLAFAKGCMTWDCGDIDDNIGGVDKDSKDHNGNSNTNKKKTKVELKEDEQEQLRKWVELYHTHDKYKYVGRLIEDPVDMIIDIDANGEG